MVELSQLDLRYEGCRLKSPAAEARLLAAIAQSGIQQPLQGVELTAARILLNGFKRLRCARNGPQRSSVRRRLVYRQQQPVPVRGHKTDGIHARYTHLETETLREAINKLPPIPE